jgi:hypothetical protein
MIQGQQFVYKEEVEFAKIVDFLKGVEFFA